MGIVNVKMGGAVIGKDLNPDDAVGILRSHFHQHVLEFLDLLNEQFPEMRALLREALYITVDGFRPSDDIIGNWTCPFCGQPFEISVR